MTGEIFVFGPFQLDSAARRLSRDGEAVPLSSRHIDLLCLLVSRAGEVLSKDTLIEAAWRDVAVTDNSVEQAISTLRRALAARSGQPYIETHARRGYRFIGDVSRASTRVSDEALDALLAPHRSWIEGRAALETLACDQTLGARDVFERVLAVVPDQAPAHVGLANACVMQFETTRADSSPDVDSLTVALRHAREACRLDSQYGEAWATLGFVLDRVGNHADALAALRRAVALEPDNWRHHFRLASVGWGEERLRAAHRTRTLLPGFQLAHWLAATVHVAREALGEAERELLAGVESDGDERQGPGRFTGVALHWLLGLIYLARGEEDRALAEFERELAHEREGHLYSRECCANTWYAIGALRLRQGNHAAAHSAFEQAIGRVPMHPMSRVGMGFVRASMRREDPLADLPGLDDPSSRLPPADRVLAQVALLWLAGRRAEALERVQKALGDAAPGNTFWLIPVEPLLGIGAARDVWASTLARLRLRAA